MNIPMALVDFIPVALFLWGAVLLQRELYPYMSKGAFALFSAGTVTVFAAGAMKALWKLLYAAGACDFERLNAAFFPMQTLGFMLAGVGVVALLLHPQGEGQKRLSAVPPIFSGTMIFVGFMVLGVAMLDGGLAAIAVKRKKYTLIPLFAVALVAALAMGYLSSRDNTSAAVNWIAEGVNTLGQACFLAGALLLHKSGDAGTAKT